MFISEIVKAFAAHPPLGCCQYLHNHIIQPFYSPLVKALLNKLGGFVSFAFVLSHFSHVYEKAG
jgi:hypothetical protein